MSWRHFLAFALGVVVGLWLLERDPPKKRIGVTLECTPPAVGI